MIIHHGSCTVIWVLGTGLSRRSLRRPAAVLWPWVFSLLAQLPDCFFFFFFLKMSPLLICSGAVAKFSSESRRGDELKGRSRLAALLNHARGGWSWSSKAAPGSEEPHCPHLPGSSERFRSHLECAVSVLDQPSVHLRHLYFLFCCILCLCQGRGKLCLGGVRSLGIKIQAFCFLIHDKPISNNVFVANFLFF